MSGRDQRQRPRRQRATPTAAAVAAPAVGGYTAVHQATKPDAATTSTVATATSTTTVAELQETIVGRWRAAQQASVAAAMDPSNQALLALLSDYFANFLLIQYGDYASDGLKNDRHLGPRYAPGCQPYGDPGGGGMRRLLTSLGLVVILIVAVATPVAAQNPIDTGSAGPGGATAGAGNSGTGTATPYPPAAPTPRRAVQLPAAPRRAAPLRLQVLVVVRQPARRGVQSDRHGGLQRHLDRHRGPRRREPWPGRPQQRGDHRRRDPSPQL